jgi:hypothetical protein
MVKPILAIAAAAACAGLVVLAPEFAPKSAMAATQSGEAGAMQADIVAKKKQQSDRGCAQHWPYYKQSCLRDARLSNGTERVVRVIAIDRTSKD